MHAYPDHIHRHPDGSIDFDRYRSEAMVLRNHAMAETSKLSAFFKVLVIAAVTVAAIAVAPANNGAGATCRDCPAETTADETANVKPTGQSQSSIVPQHPPVY